MKNDHAVRVLLTVIAALLAANLLVKMAPAVSPAYGAGIPDSGAQMQAAVDQLKDLNKKVDDLHAFLESGSLTVKMADPKTDK